MKEKIEFVREIGEMGKELCILMRVMDNITQLAMYLP